jgi:hypothetical protein
MGWYIFGNRILSDEEMSAKSAEFLDIAVPSVVTGIAIWILSHMLTAIDFFAVHTTTTKMIYAVFGFTVFMLSYAYRKLIVALATIAFFGFILLGAGAAFVEWVLK